MNPNLRTMLDRALPWSIAALAVFLFGGWAGFAVCSRFHSLPSGPDRGSSSEKRVVAPAVTTQLVNIPDNPAGSAEQTNQDRSSSPAPTHLQTVHLSIPIPSAPTAPAPMPAPAHDARLGTWTFKADDLVFTFNEQKPERSTVQRMQKYAVFLTMELSRRVKSTVVDQKLFRLHADNTIAEEVKDAKWEIALLQQLNVREPLAELRQSLGFGVSIGGWRDATPVITYSPLRVGRFRPSVMADLQKHIGAGLQYRLWRPFHAGTFYAIDLDDTTDRTIRFTITAGV